MYFRVPRPASLVPASPKEKSQFGWCMYDWANSAFATVILAAVLPVYFASLAPVEGIPVFWSARPLPTTAFWGYTVSCSLALVALAAPGLGSLADRKGWRRPLLILFCIIGSIATSALFFAGPGRYLLAAGLFVIANVGFAAGNIFYNAFLPGLSAEGDTDRLSARGFAFGYLGGGLMLLIVFLLIQGHEWFGIPDKGLASRIGFLLTGAWWLGFALPTFLWVRDEAVPTITGHVPRTPLDYLRVFLNLKDYPNLLRFLLAFLVYNDGIQTIIAISAIFASVELGLGQGTILGCFLMIQFVATPGALLFGRLAGRWGAKRTILTSLVIFIAIAIYASVMRSAVEFWFLGFAVALVLGGSQAISRSLFASMVPTARSAEFFGFYAVSSKFASIFGPLAFALIIDLTGSNRAAILSLVAFFLVGILLLLTVNVERGRHEAAGQGLETR